MRKPTHTMKPCDHCGKQFKSFPNRPGRFCSRTCYWAHRWKHSGACAQCGKPSVTRYCSPRCQRDYWNAHGYFVHKKHRIWDRKLALVERLGGKCRECGESDFRVLDINHVDRRRKNKPPKRQWSWGRRFRDWEKHLDNLELLCANCHRRHTWEQMGYGKTSRS